MLSLSFTSSSVSTHPTPQSWPKSLSLSKNPIYPCKQSYWRNGKREKMPIYISLKPENWENSKFCFPTLKNMRVRNGFPIAIDLKCGKIKECVVKTFNFWLYCRSYLLNWETLNWSSFSSVAHQTDFRWNCPKAEVRNRRLRRTECLYLKEWNKQTKKLGVPQSDPWMRVHRAGADEKKVDNKTSAKPTLKPGEIYFL